MLLFTLVIFLGISSFAQENGTCQQTKMGLHQQPHKKHRAGASDNALMNQYDVHFYFLDLAIERNSTVLSGSVTMGVNTTAIMDTFCFELNNTLTIDSVMYNGISLQVARVGNISYAKFPSSILSGQSVSVQIFYHGDASVTGGSAIGDGFATDTSPSWGNQVTWSLSQPYSAYEWFPCKQFLQDKTDSTWVFVTTSNQNKVGSNGTLEGVDSLPNNKVRYRWKSHYIMDYYLISVAVAKYVDYTIYAHPVSLPNDSIKIVNYVYDNPNTLTTFKSKIDSNALVLEYFSDLFGLYPFYQEKYGHAMAPIGGGMEHQTMSTMGNLGNFGVNSHELMHQWFGDHVTCKTWKDIFINEGFASYGEYLAYEHFRSLNAAKALMQSLHDDILTDPTAMVYFTDTTDVNRIFSSLLTYDKGSAVIHTLRFVMGDSLFFAGLKHFQTQFSFSTASIDDLKLSLENFSGMNLSDYFNQWLYGEGYPTFSAEYFSNGTSLFLKVTHTTSSTVTPLFKTPLEIKCVSASGDTTIRVDITQNANEYIIPCTKTISNLQFDPNNWLLNKEGWVTKNPDLISLNVNELLLENSIVLYPNPCHEKLILQCSSDPNATFTCQDINGRQVMQGVIGDIQVNGLPSGFYFLSVHTKYGQVNRKFVVE